MGLKEDWSFLDKISMGAVATTKLTGSLNLNGHEIIELERYSSSNKMWSTKIKRLRIPDLLCLKCGRRIESKAKSKLGIIMSDTETNEDRFWDVGLRDDDLLAFIKCTKINNSWVPANTINLFTIKSLRDTVGQTSLGPPKSVNEGAERDREWKSYVPSFNGVVTSIQGKKISYNKDGGGRASKTCNDNHNIFVSAGDQIEAGSKIVSSIVTGAYSHTCDHRGYDFIADLESNNHETKYCAVKALGFLPALRTTSVPRLRRLLGVAGLDERIRLEAFASLIRLGETDLWEHINNYFNIDNDIEGSFRMEATLILTELISIDESRSILQQVAASTLDSEIRASAVWGLGHSSLAHSIVLDYVDCQDETISGHAIAILEKKVTIDLTQTLLDHLDQTGNKNAAISRIISNASTLDDRRIIEELVHCDSPTKRQWILYAVGLGGRTRFEQIIREVDDEAETTISFLILLWDNRNAWLSTMEERIEFIKKQN